jgi:hypothetical protein
MFRPCWAIFTENFFVIVTLRLHFIVEWECAVGCVLRCFWRRELPAIPACRPGPPVCSDWNSIKMKMHIGIGGMFLASETRSTRTKPSPAATLFTTNLAWTGAGWHPGLRGGRPATNRLSHDGACKKDGRSETHFIAWMERCTTLLEGSLLTPSSFWYECYENENRIATVVAWNIGAKFWLLVSA